VEVPAGKTEELLVAQERQIDRTVLLTNINDNQITYFISARNVDRRVKQALEGLAERKTVLSQTIRERQEQERKVNTIHREQSRIRDNMARLERSSSLYKRYVSLLNEQEDLLEDALSQIEDLRVKEQRQREELDRYILSLDFP
jgi:septal ring factor EnvC (AmiA/AmiB activator)